MTPSDAIVAATRNGAMAAGMLDELGAVGAGLSRRVFRRMGNELDHGVHPSAVALPYWLSVASM